MDTKMVTVLNCNATGCSFNIRNKCRAKAITIGGGECPECDTSLMSDKKGGCIDVIAGVGACKVESCKFNNCLECGAEGIQVKMHAGHVDCGTYKSL